MASSLLRTGVTPFAVKRPSSRLLGQAPQAYVNDTSDPTAGIAAPGQPWNYYVDPGKNGYDRITKQMTDDALKAGIFYGTGYEGSKALENPRTKEDFAATQMYATRDPITALGFDPSVMDLRTNGAADSLDGDSLAGMYMLSRPQGEWNKIKNIPAGNDQIVLPASSFGDGVPVAFSPRVAAHESTHRGLSKMVDAVYGRPGAYFGLGGGGVQPWVDTSKLTSDEMSAMSQLRDITDNPDANRAENEWLTRMVEARLTGDPGTMIEVQSGKAYQRMTPEDQTRMHALLGNLETAAAKINAQRRPGGPR